MSNGIVGPVDRTSGDGKTMFTLGKRSIVVQFRNEGDRVFQFGTRQEFHEARNRVKQLLAERGVADTLKTTFDEMAKEWDDLPDNCFDAE